MGCLPAPGALIRRRARETRRRVAYRALLARSEERTMDQEDPPQTGSSQPPPPMSESTPPPPPQPTSPPPPPQTTSAPPRPPAPPRAAYHWRSAPPESRSSPFWPPSPACSVSSVVSCWSWVAPRWAWPPAARAWEPSGDRWRRAAHFVGGLPAVRLGCLGPAAMGVDAGHYPRRRADRARRGPALQRKSGRVGQHPDRGRDHLYLFQPEVKAAFGRT